MATRVGAFFDVDKTILAENSGTLYLKALYQRGEVDVGFVLSNLLSYLQYKLNLLDIERFTQRTVRQFKGRSEKLLLDEAAVWFGEYLLPTIYPAAIERIEAHKARGDVVALVSGATGYIVQPLARHLGIDHTMHTRMEVVDGVFTGRVIQPVCFGEGKIMRCRTSCVVSRDRPVPICTSHWSRQLSMPTSKFSRRSQLPSNCSSTRDRSVAMGCSLPSRLRSARVASR